MSELANDANLSRATDVLIGTKVGNYRLVTKLGAGGMGVVYAAEHELMGKKAAVKLLLPELSANQEIVGRFFNEAKAATRINHPGIVDVYDFGYHQNGHAYIVMEFLSGESLADLLKKGLQFGRAVDIAWQLSSALGAAHKRGIVHRDVKPDNVFVVPDPATPTGDRVKVLDFGIAKLTADDNMSMKTRTGTVMGTPVYMSPEQCRGSGEIDHRSDIYAMGVIMFEMACGQPPFVRNGFGELITAHIIEEPPMLSQLNPSVPRSYEAIVMRMLRKDPAARFQSTDEVENQLGAIDPNELVDVAKIPTVGRAGTTNRSKVRSNRSLAAKAGAGAFQITAPEVVDEEQPVPAPNRKRLLALGVGGLVALAVIVGVFARAGKKELAAVPVAQTVVAPASAPAPAPVPARSELSAVKIDITSTPPGAALIRAEDSAFVGRTPYHASLPRSSREMTLIVRREGFEDQRLVVPLLEDGKSDVTLRAIVAAGAPPPAHRAPASHGKTSGDARAKAGGPAATDAGGGGKGKKKKRDWGEMVDF